MLAWLRRNKERRVENSGGGQRDEKPRLLSLGLAAIPGAIIDVEGIPQPQWRLIRRDLERRFSEADRQLLWHSACLEWMHILKEALGEGFTISESQNFVFLSSLLPAKRRELEKASEQLLGMLRLAFGEAAKKRGYGKNLILSFNDEETYYRYISHFYPQGTFPQSDAICLSYGYRHVVLKEDYHVTTLAHELTHVVFGALGHPTWLSEGLAQWSASKVDRYRGYRDDVFASHEHFWNTESIQDFWSGRSFKQPGESVLLSYSLAEFLTKLLFEDHGEHVHEFIAEASAKDAGEAAAKKHLGVTLGEVAGAFLGTGDWERQTAPTGSPTTTPPSAEPQPGSAAAHQDPAPNSFQKEAGILMELIRGQQLTEARALWEKHVATAESAQAKAIILDQVASIPLLYECDHFLGEALDLCTRALGFSPGSSTLIVTRIGLLTRAGRCEEVPAQVATHAMEELTNRDRAMIQYYLALAEHNLGNTVDAEKALQEAIELGPLLGLRAECELTLRGHQELME